MSVTEIVENKFNSFIKQYPRIGDGGAVSGDLENIEKILIPILKQNIQIAEVGTWTGKITLLLATLSKPFNGKIYAIDHFKGQAEMLLSEQPQVFPHKKILPVNVLEWKASDDIEQIFRENMRTHQVDTIVEFMRMSSIEASNRFEDNYFDFIFVDASHDYESVKCDLEAWYPKLKIGGIIAGHDFEEIIPIEEARGLWEKFSKKFFACHCHPGVIYAVVEKFPNVIHCPKRIWYYKKEK